MSAFLLVATALAADCLAPAGLDELDVALEHAELGYADLDSAAFQQGLDEVALIVPCLDALVSLELAARLHRLSGLSAYGQGEQEEALGAFAAARAADPAYRFPYDLVPPGHALHGLFETAMLADADAEPMPEPLGVALYLDGVPASGRQPDRPTIFQVVDDGAVVTSAWLAMGRELPEYPQLRPPPPPPPPLPDPVVTSGPEPGRSGPALGLMAGGAGAAVVGVGVAGWQAWRGSLYYNNCLTAKTIGSAGTCKALQVDYERAEQRYAVGLALGGVGVTTAGTGLLLSSLGVL